MPISRPNVVILVPFTSQEESRILLWKHVKSWLQKTLDYPIVQGKHAFQDASLFNISIARNDAAQRAGDDWDVAIIHDADTILNPQQIKDGVRAAYETGAVTYPFTERYELDHLGTKMLLKDENSNWQAHLQKYTRNQPLGGCMIVRRDMWDLVRGFDSGFVGWGHEDGAFANACYVLSGKPVLRLPGKSLHLEHVKSPAKNSTNPIYLKNKKRIEHYLGAVGRPDAISVYSELRNKSIRNDTEHNIKWKYPKLDDKTFKHVALKMLLNDVASLLEHYGCTYWLSDGTLLGAIRENNLILHDHDIDLGVWAEDFDIRVIHDLLKKYGCSILRMQGKPEDGMIITIGRVGFHLDMFFYYPNNKNAKSADKNTIYSCLYELIKPYSTSNKAKRYDCVFPNFQPLVQREFLDRKYWVPKNAKEHLKAAYGHDWVVKKENWDLFKDQKNLKSHSLIADMAADRRKVEEYLKLRKA
jgi:hypothetical protein